MGQRKAISKPAMFISKYTLYLPTKHQVELETIFEKYKKAGNMEMEVPLSDVGMKKGKIIEAQRRAIKPIIWL